MRKRWRDLGLLAILLVAASLRFTGIDWDAYRHYHPDERYILWVATTIEWPQSLATAFNPEASSFNPYRWPDDASSAGIVVPQGERRNFAYGHLPLYLGVAATRLMEWVGPVVAPYLPGDWLLTRDILNNAGAVEFNHMTAVARALTALVDTATVLLIFLLGQRVFGTAAGLLAVAFLALNVMHIQLAHFFAVDPYVTFFAVLAVTLMVVSLQEIRPRRRFVYGLLAGASVGLAVGAKFAAFLLFLPLALLFLIPQKEAWQQRLWQGMAAVGAAFLAFAITNPFAVLDFGCDVITPAFRWGPVRIPALDWGNCFLHNVVRQSEIVSGRADAAFARQYLGTLPYAYFVEMQLKWGMGFLLGLVAFAGFGWAVGRGIGGLLRQVEWILLAWTLPFFLFTGALHVKFMRYLQPLTPFLMLYGAALLLAWQRERARRLAIAVILLGTGLYALAFVNLYEQSHPWAAASRWMHRNIPEGARIAGELWDEELPSSIEVDGQWEPASQYQVELLTWLSGADEEDDLAKLRHNLGLLSQADYLTVASNRIHGVVTRLPDRYPLTSQFYPLLFDSSLGFEPVYIAGRGPHLGPYQWQPDPFAWTQAEPPAAATAYIGQQSGLIWGRDDESFTVYDQPFVIVFENRGRLTLEEILAQFDTEAMIDE